MKQDWKKVELGEVITLKRGYDLPKKRRKTGEVPIVSSSGITGYHCDSKVIPPGVVTGRCGTLGEVFYILRPFWPLNTTLYVKEFKGNDPQFVSYLLKTLDFASLSAAAAVPGLNRNHLHLLPVNLPPLPTQKKIAGILSGYDELIENNRRRIQILEEMAQTIYREWFVNFKFPGHEEVKMNGEIPEGWEGKLLPECVDINPRVVLSRDAEKPFVPMGCLSSDSMIISNIESRVKNSGAKFQNGDTLFARITPCLENGKTGFVQFLPNAAAAACGSTEFIVLRSRTLTPELIYCLARSDEFRSNAIKSMSGASGRQRVQQQCFHDFEIIQPSQEMLDKFSAVVVPSFRLVCKLSLKNENIRATRDLLLPKLISGEIEV